MASRYDCPHPRTTTRPEAFSPRAKRLGRREKIGQWSDFAEIFGKGRFRRVARFNKTNRKKTPCTHPSERLHVIQGSFFPIPLFTCGHGAGLSRSSWCWIRIDCSQSPKKKNWTTTKQRIIPFLTEANKEQRVLFSKIWLRQTASDTPTAPNPGNTMFWRVHLDEKWFYLHPKGTLLYLPPGVNPPHLKAKSKRFIPKVMFLAAVGQPTDSFDGAVGIWPIEKLHTPLRASKDHPRVDGQLVPYLKSCTMDGEIFVRMIKTLFIPKMVEIGIKTLLSKPPGTDLVIWAQVDNAGGHKLKTTLTEINLAGATAHSKIRIHFHAQPPNSPDMNVLDLGAWNSLQTTVPALIYEHLGDSNEKRIIRAVEESFLLWNAREKCNSLFHTLKIFMAETISSGGNNSKQPHYKNIKEVLVSLEGTAEPAYPSLPPPPALPLPPPALSLPPPALSLPPVRIRHHILRRAMEIRPASDVAIID